jgi:hypothetical protein
VLLARLSKLGNTRVRSKSRCVAKGGAARVHNYIIVEDRNSGQEKGYPNLDQTFQPDFHELLFISIALKLIEISDDFDGNHDCSVRIH